jgi:hypothetical protein
LGMWDSARVRLGRVRQSRWLAVALIVGAVGCAGCGDESEGAGEATAGSTVAGSATGPGASGAAILIKTEVNLPTGVVLDGSSIGDSPFCAGGTFRDQAGGPSPGSMDRTFRCPEGTLRIGFTTGTGKDRKQTGSWTITSGTGAFAGLEGSGAMEIEVQPDSNRKGHETFTGTLGR